MSLIECRALIQCNPAQAFHASQDYALRRIWDPFAAKLQSEHSENGLRRVTVTAWHGATMQVEYVAWLPPERAAIRMVSGPALLAGFAGTWAFIPTDSGGTDARFRYQIKAAQGWRWLEPLMQRYFQWETRRRLQALKRYLESRTHA